MRSWLTIVCTLSVTLCGVTVATILRKHRVHNANVQLASIAIPLMDLRSDVIRLQDENDRRNQLCQRVESTRPDDGVLQTLAALAVASQSQTHETIIDSVHVRLPVEFPITAKETPAWAVPQISISARITTDVKINQWIDDLNSFDRIEAVSIVADDHDSADEQLEMNDVIRRVRLSATPIATRVLP